MSFYGLEEMADFPPPPPVLPPRQWWWKPLWIEDSDVWRQSVEEVCRLLGEDVPSGPEIPRPTMRLRPD